MHRQRWWHLSNNSALIVPAVQGIQPGSTVQNSSTSNETEVLPTTSKESCASAVSPALLRVLGLDREAHCACDLQSTPGKTQCSSTSCAGCPNRPNSEQKKSESWLNKVYILHGTCNAVVLFSNMSTLWWCCWTTQANCCPELTKEHGQKERWKCESGYHTASGNLQQMPAPAQFTLLFSPHYYAAISLQS